MLICSWCRVAVFIFTAKGRFGCLLSECFHGSSRTLSFEIVSRYRRWLQIILDLGLGCSSLESRPEDRSLNIGFFPRYPL